MKHVKLFEEFVNEAEKISLDAFDKLEKLAKELLNNRLAQSNEYHEYATQLELLKWEIIIAKHKGDPSAEKLEKKQEALNQKRINAENKWNFQDFEDKIKEDPEMSKILKKLGKFEYSNYKTDIFNLIARLSSDQVGIKSYATLIAGLKKISPKDLTEDQLYSLKGLIETQTRYMDKAKENLPVAVKSVNDVFAKIKDLKTKAGKGSLKKTDTDKIRAEYEKKIEALEKKADRHYSKGEDIPREDPRYSNPATI
jgi:hypothetical protein